MKKKKWFAPTSSLFPMDEVLDAQVTILHAQVRKTPSVHGIDANGFIRPENHPEIEQKILLGEICETLFRVIKAKENPLMDSPPNIKIVSKTKNVLNEVFIVLDSVLFNALSTT